MKIINTSELERDILPSIEIISIQADLYHFSSYFKLNRKVMSHIIKKYEEGSRFFKKKEYRQESYLWIGDEINKNQNMSSHVKYKEIIYAYNLGKEMQIAFYKRGEDAYIITQSRVLGFPTRGEWIRFKDITFSKDKKDTYTMQGNHNGKVVRHADVPLKLVRLIEELKVLNKEVPIRYNRHPYYLLPFEERKQYVKVLAYICCREGYLIAHQIGRLEQIARQLNVDSKYVMACLSQGLVIEKKDYLRELQVNIDIIKEEHYTTLLIDFLTMNIIGEKMGVKSLISDKELRRMLKIPFSEFVDIRKQLCYKLSEYC